MAANTFETAFKLHTLGFCVIPSGSGDKGKAPLVKWAQFQDQRPDDADLERWNQELNPNLWGIVTGAISGVVVIDADNSDTRAILESQGLTPHVITPRGGAHFYFQHPRYEVKTIAGLLPGLDSRADGGFVNIVGRNSVTGGEYKVVELPTGDNLIPWDKLPAVILKAMSNNGTKPALDNADAIIPEHERNSRLAKLAGSMRHNGMTQSAIEVALLAVNNTQCKPPLPDNEVLGIAKSISRYKPAPAADKTFNQTREKQHHMMSLSSWRQAVLADPPRNDLIEDVIPNSPSEYCIICGRAGIGKTNLALGMGFCLATGRPWFSHKTTKCKVGYLAFEGPKAKLLGRVEKLLISYPDAEPNLYIERSLPFKLVDKALDDFKFLIEGLDVVIIDPIREIVPGDYTKPEYASTFITALKTVCNEAHTVAILLHHIRKPDKRVAVRPEDLQFEVKGASDYVDAAGTLLLLERARQARKSDGRFGSNPDDRTLHFCKVKDSPGELYPLYLRFNRNTLIFEPHSFEYNDEDYGFNEN